MKNISRRLPKLSAERRDRHHGTAQFQRTLAVLQDADDERSRDAVGDRPTAGSDAIDEVPSFDDQRFGGVHRGRCRRALPKRDGRTNLVKTLVLDEQFWLGGG